METQLPCMQHLTRKVFSQPRRVDFVTQHWIAKMMQMHPNLMCAATLQFAFNETRLLARAKDSIFSFGRAAAGRIHAHPLPMHRMTSDFVFNYTCLSSQCSSNQREVNLFYSARGEL